MQFLFSFLLLINYVSGLSLHDFHVSVCSIDYRAEKKTLEISHRIFLDDLETAMRKEFGDSYIDVVNPKDKDRFAERLEEYVIKKFELTVNGKEPELNYLGAEIEDDVMYCYIEVEGVKKLKSVSVENKILMELFADQVNLVHVKAFEKTRSMKLDIRNSWDELVWEK